MKFGEVVHGMVFSFLCHPFCAKDLKLLISLPIAARVVTDRVSGFSKGFGFVRYATTEEATKGIEGMDGKVWLLYIYFVLYKLECCFIVLAAVDFWTAAFLPKKSVSDGAKH